MSDDNPPVMLEIPTPKMDARKAMIAKLEELLAQAKSGEVVGIVGCVRYQDARGADTLFMGETHYLELLGMLQLVAHDLAHKSRRDG